MMTKKRSILKEANIKRLNKSVIFITLAGLFPLTIGAINFVQNITLGAGFSSIHHIAFTNLIFSGVTLITLGHLWQKRPSFGIKIFTLALLLWVGGNDLMAIVMANLRGSSLPLWPVFPIILGTVGLILMQKESTKVCH